MTPPTVQFIPAGGDDWDTNEDGIFAFYWTSNGNQPVANAFYQKEILSSSINYNDPASGGGSFLRANYYGTNTLRFYNSTNNMPPWIALWDTVNEVWHVGEKVNASTTDSRYDLSGTMPDSTTGPWEIMVMIYLPSDPGDISGWRDYDGPAPTLTVYP
jgi:hypothetical protein